MIIFGISFQNSETCSTRYFQDVSDEISFLYLEMEMNIDFKTRSMRGNSEACSTIKLNSGNYKVLQNFFKMKIHVTLRCDEMFL